MAKIIAKSKMLKFLTISAAGTALVGVGAGLGLVLGNDNNNKPEITFDTTEKEKLPQSQLSLKIGASVTFDDASSEGKLEITNKPENNYDVIVEIYLEDSNELVYKTPKLKPGESINRINLQKKLKKGSYAAIAYYNAYNSANKYVGKSGARITINVKN